jgi:hypothetical protein
MTSALLQMSPGQRVSEKELAPILRDMEKHNDVCGSCYWDCVDYVNELLIVGRDTMPMSTVLTRSEPPSWSQKYEWMTPLAKPRRKETVKIGRAIDHYCGCITNCPFVMDFPQDLAQNHRAAFVESIGEGTDPLVTLLLVVLLY